MENFEIRTNEVDGIDQHMDSVEHVKEEEGKLIEARLEKQIQKSTERTLESELDTEEKRLRKLEEGIRKNNRDASDYPVPELNKEERERELYNESYRPETKVIGDWSSPQEDEASHSIRQNFVRSNGYRRNYEDNRSDDAGSRFNNDYRRNNWTRRGNRNYRNDEGREYNDRLRKDQNYNQTYNQTIFANDFYENNDIALSDSLSNLELADNDFRHRHRTNQFIKDADTDSVNKKPFSFVLKRPDNGKVLVRQRTGPADFLFENADATGIRLDASNYEILEISDDGSYLKLGSSKILSDQTILIKSRRHAKDCKMINYVKSYKSLCASQDSIKAEYDEVKTDQSKRWLKNLNEEIRKVKLKIEKNVFLFLIVLGFFLSCVSGCGLDYYGINYDILPYQMRAIESNSTGTIMPICNENNPESSPDCYLSELKTKNTCICHNISISIIMYLKYPDGNYRLPPDGYEPCIRSHPASSLIMKGKRSIFEVSDQDCPSVVISLNNDAIKISMLSQVTMIYIISKDSIIETGIFSSSVTLNLKEEFFTSSGSINVKLNMNNVLCKEQDFQITGRQNCLISDCILCYSTISSYSCSPPTVKLTIILMIVMVILMCLALVPCSIALIQSFCSVAIIPCSCCYERLKMKEKIRMMKEAIIAQSQNAYPGMRRRTIIKDSQDLEKFDEERIVCRVHSSLENIRCAIHDKKNCLSDECSITKRYKCKNNKCSYFILFMMFLTICSATTCSNTYSIEAQAQNCVSNGVNSMICSVVSNTQLTIQEIGLSACITISINGSLLATVDITYLNSSYLVSDEIDYYTSGWLSYSSYVHYCYTPAGNPCPNSCAGASSDTSVEGVITDANVVGFTGMGRCDRTCGCISCASCFYCVASCLFSSYAIQPNGAVYVVRSPNAITLIPFVRILITYQNGTIFSQDVQVGQLVNQPGLIINPIGSFIKEISILSDQKLIVGPGSWLGFASNQQQPIAGSIGDIQSDSQNDLYSGKFIYDSSIAEYTNQQTSAVYSFYTQGIDSISSATQLPASIDGTIWSLNSAGQLTGLLNSAGALLIALQTSSSYQLTNKINVICPQLISCSNASGCYNCQTGSTVTVTIFSSCLSGTILMSYSGSASLGQPTLTISTTPESYIVYFQVEESEADVIIDFYYGPNSASCEFSFYAVSNVSLTLGNYTAAQTKGYDAESPFSFSFLNPSNAFSYGMIVLIAIFSFIIIVCLILFILKVVCGCCNQVRLMSNKSD
jgi:hypothetical protein